MRDRLDLDARYTKMLRPATEQYPNLTVVDGRGASYPPRHFIDATHLDFEGAYVYSDDLSALLARPPGGPRWVRLPAYRDRPVEIPLEDYRASTIALSGWLKSSRQTAVAELEAAARGKNLRR